MQESNQDPNHDNPIDAAPSTQEVVQTHVRGAINWINTTFLTVLPVASIVGLIFYIYFNGVHWSDVASLAFMYVASGLAITAGYHRYYSHRSFECNGFVQYLFLLFGAAAFQNSVLCWADDHRIHHRHVDGEKDPYNIKKGFFWAHMGWIFFDDAAPKTYQGSPDLTKDPRVLWQHRFYVLIGIVVGFGMPALVGWAFGRPLGGLIWGGFLRLVMVHHSTFLINSAAHYFGKQPYSERTSARDSGWLAFLSFGEGYHNFHHTFPSDYRNGIAWHHWDPTKWLIQVFSKIGFARNLKKTSESIIQKAREQRLMNISRMQ